MAVTQSYRSKVTPNGELYALKIAVAVLLYLAFPESLFSHTLLNLSVFTRTGVLKEPCHI